MSHPVLGLPPADPTAGLPDAARRLRADRGRLASVALEQAVRRDPTLPERYDDLALRYLLRDYERHIEQLAQALETGESRFVTSYAEWLIPVYRRRHVPARDLATLVEGLRDAAHGLLAPAEIEALDDLAAAWVARLRFHGRLPGDHKGNPVVRFVFKGAGIGDDSVV